MTRLPGQKEERDIKLQNTSRSMEELSKGGSWCFQKRLIREKKNTLEKKLKREEEEELKQVLWHFGKKKFHFEQDARKAFEEVKKGYKLHVIKEQLTPLDRHSCRGKPKKDTEKVIIGYRVDATFERSQEEISKLMNKKGRFILATNEMDSERYKNEEILEEYKEQQNVEGGF